MSGARVYDIESKMKRSGSSTTDDTSYESRMSIRSQQIKGKVTKWVRSCTWLTGLAASVIEFGLLIALFRAPTHIQSSIQFALIGVGILIFLIVVNELFIPIARITLIRRRRRARIQAQIEELRETAVQPCAPAANTLEEDSLFGIESSIPIRTLGQLDLESDFQPKNQYKNPIDRYINSTNAQVFPHHKSTLDHHTVA